MSDKLSLTTLLAIWGAFLSSLNFAWNFYRDFLKRGRLRIKCYIGNIVNPITGTEHSNYLIWNITNIGGETIILTDVGGAFNNGRYFIISSPQNKLPMALKPGEYIIEYTSKFNVENIKHLWAIDSIGRTFKAPCKQILELKKKHINKNLNEKK